MSVCCIKQIHKFLDICLSGNIIVGADIQQDLKSLEYTFHNVEDLQDTFRDRDGPFNLRMLVQLLLKNRSGFQTGHHSAIDDARMTLALYKKKNELIELGTFDDKIQYLTSKRTEYKLSKPKIFAEKCSCK